MAEHPWTSKLSRKSVQHRRTVGVALIAARAGFLPSVHEEGLEPSERRWRNLQAVRGLARQRRGTRWKCDGVDVFSSARESRRIELNRASFGQRMGNGF